MSPVIRPAAPDDAPAACTVLRRSILESCAADHRHDQARLDAWLGNKTPAQVVAWMSAPANHMLVAERDGALVGVALITQGGKLSLCYVLPEAQHCGVGKALLGAAEAKAREWGVGVLRLHSTTAGSGFYARHGYVNAGKDKTCYGLECEVFWKKLDAEPGAAGTPGKRFCNCTGS
ncbi:GNAT family N-acetyltransferase [Massilia sp. R2A-15]|uniref:GNAT family N-acetyltransferase n=1 Tax=Massilia sp. R2A-15 TaxID=3064278 RepID=UPI002733CF55|nr:GNAT family N-acetyltransferase [Massilia sp. R2A-15]WLI91556.1 GNAT family N-acetyltransferase [Massilia sp. R2A-15]